MYTTGTFVASLYCCVLIVRLLCCMLRRIYPVSPEMFTNTILTNLTVLNDCPTQVVDAFTLPVFVWNGKAMANMVIGIKFKAHLPDRAGFNLIQQCAASDATPSLSSGAARAVFCLDTARSAVEHAFSVVATTALPLGSARHTSRQCRHNHCNTNTTILFQI